MAKRTTRSRADDATAENPGKAQGRTKARRELGPEAIANREPDTAKPNTIAAGPETISEQLGDPDRVRQSPGDVFAAAGSDAARQPSEDAIRERAYQRYLERGGGHGMDFEDWLQAERELKGQGR